MTRASRHGKKRLKERAGISPSSAHRQATLAKARGLRHGDTSGALFKWISSISCNYGNQKGSTYIVYSNSLFIFNKSCDVLITVINLPSNLLKSAALQASKQK